ncbi:MULTISPECIES: formylglycine-generating enzyme family protein [Variovorax]|uniref:formylglycine-generating enzyme family protein n=1 Tax=Variovorax TaxID=34072 RepID=UPI0028671EC1|nr:SUMF1/EgtB/PvdO family nonheme iron enzyme [Variovorax sp. 3319]MDR6891005.1 formylglycine-generating enzyme required for sulfatase activity [Variovorax sp. 3319]
MKERLSSLNIEMVTLPAGLIAMRDDRIGRVWSVQMESFELATTPITQQAYEAVTGGKPSAFEGADCPVESVSWFDAVQFCNQLSETCGLEPVYLVRDQEVRLKQMSSSPGFRLPSEAEWEYACRAGTREARYGKLGDIAWYRKNAAGRSQPVGLKGPNAWGLHDMLGNVWEWCSDQYDPEVYGLYRVFRGGGWADDERGCLASNRRRSHPTFTIDDLGFRIARSLPS